eukprot:gene46504-56944_t
MGFGYRNKFITGTVQFILQENASNNVDWLERLRASSYFRQVSEGAVESAESEAKNRKGVQAELCRLPGVGPKVADCVALFSLDQPNIVPVDTHVWRIATRDYAPQLANSRSSSLTPAVYDSVGDVFRRLFQRNAGWAHSVLFAAELPAFREQLPAQLVSDMKRFDDVVKQEKAEVKKEKARKKMEKNLKVEESQSSEGGAIDENVEVTKKKVKREKK